MIIFQSIKFRNVLSYGNTFTTFEFTNGINRIQGANGSGKSSVIEALYFCCFGTSYRKLNLSQLISTINKKELEVSLNFRIANGASYRIDRGQKNNYFRVFKKDDPSRDFCDEDIVPVPSSTRSYQQILEEDILHMSPEIFEQTVLKSLTKNISFLTLKKADKRELIENILDIKVFTNMNKVTKDKVDTMTKTLVLDNKDLEHTTSSIATEKDNLTKLKLINEGIEKDLVEKKKQTLYDIKVLEVQNIKYQKAIIDIEPWKVSKAKLQAEVATLNEKISDTKLDLRREVNTLEEDYRERRIAVDIEILESGITLKEDKFYIQKEICEHMEQRTLVDKKLQETYASIKDDKAECNKQIQIERSQINALEISNAEIQVKIDFMTKTCTDCPKAKELMGEDVTNGIGTNNKSIKLLEKLIIKHQKNLVELEDDQVTAEDLTKKFLDKIDINIQKCNDQIKELEESYTSRIMIFNKQKEDLIAECRKEELLLTEKYDMMDLDTVNRIAELNEEIKECDKKMKAIVDEVSK